MNVDSWNKTLTLVANFGVLIGIFVLAVEVRQNQEILEEEQEMNLLTARTSDIQQYHDWRAMLIQDEELVQLWLDGVEGKELDSVQDTRFMLMCISTIWFDASMYERSMVLDREDTTARTIARDLHERNIEQPGYKGCWEATRDAVRDYGFGDFVDAVEAGG